LQVAIPVRTRCWQLLQEITEPLLQLSSAERGRLTLYRRLSALRSGARISRSRDGYRSDVKAVTFLPTTAFRFGNPLRTGLNCMPNVNTVALRLADDQPRYDAARLQYAQFAHSTAAGQLLRSQEHGVAEGFLQMIQGSGGDGRHPGAV
jgi:hypothetical protein